MPELPEVEAVARHLAPRIQGRTIESSDVLCLRTIRPLTPGAFHRAVVRRRITRVWRRAKYLILDLAVGSEQTPAGLVAHLGMTGRLFLQKADDLLPRHTVAALGLGADRLLFTDVRKFGRIHTTFAVLERLGPEPLSPALSSAFLARALNRSRRPIKVCLMDPAVIAGLGNIYASESLFRAGIPPQRPAGQLSINDCRRLRRAIRQVLSEAIQRNVRNSLASGPDHERLFYHRQGPPSGAAPAFHVYDRAGMPCTACGTPIRRIFQASRSSFWCPTCQP